MVRTLVLWARAACAGRWSGSWQDEDIGGYRSVGPWGGMGLSDDGQGRSWTGGLTSHLAAQKPMSWPCCGWSLNFRRLPIISLGPMTSTRPTGLGLPHCAIQAAFYSIGQDAYKFHTAGFQMAPWHDRVGNAVSSQDPLHSLQEQRLRTTTGHSQFTTSIEG